MMRRATLISARAGNNPHDQQENYHDENYQSHSSWHRLRGDSPDPECLRRRVLFNAG